MRTSGMNAASFSISCPICTASSRVGASTSSWMRVSVSEIYSSMGMPKAQVLPVPVGAMPITSCPSIMTGMVFA